MNSSIDIKTRGTEFWWRKKRSKKHSYDRDALPQQSPGRCGPRCRQGAAQTVRLTCGKIADSSTEVPPKFVRIAPLPTFQAAYLRGVEVADQRQKPFSSRGCHGNGGRAGGLRYPDSRGA